MTDIDGDPEGEATKDLDFLLGEVFRNNLCKCLCCLFAALQTLREVGRIKDIGVSVDGGKD